MSRINSCKDCMDRAPKCHSCCPNYAKFREELENRKQCIKEKRGDQDYVAYLTDAMRRMSKGKRK